MLLDPRSFDQGSGGLLGLPTDEQSGPFGRLDPNFLLALGAGIASGRNWGEGIGRGLQLGLQAKQAGQSRAEKIAMLRYQLSKDERDFAFRQTEAQRAQQNADRADQRLRENADYERNKPRWHFGTQYDAEGRPQPGWMIEPGSGAPPVAPAAATTGAPATAAAPPAPATPGFIPVGGPKVQTAQEKALPVELAARVGMAGKFLDEAPLIRPLLERGDVTGLIDSTMAHWNARAPGELKRKVQSGTDALLRNLTGAGMPYEEAKKYVARYEPEPNDTASTVVSKFDQLADELRRIEEKAYSGRGGVPKGDADRRQLINEAAEAIAKGANRNEVFKRLRQHGVNFAYDY